MLQEEGEEGEEKEGEGEGEEEATAPGLPFIFLPIAGVKASQLGSKKYRSEPRLQTFAGKRKLFLHFAFTAL